MRRPLGDCLEQTVCITVGVRGYHLKTVFKIEEIDAENYK